MVQEGLRAYGETALLQVIAERYFNAVVAAYMADKTITEGVLADKVKSYGNLEFVGWGGVGPVANFIEYILGFDLNVLQHTITWRISRPERHGIKNLKFGDFYVELLSEERKARTDLCHVTIISGGTFNLKMFVNGKNIERTIEEGNVIFRL